MPKSARSPRPPPKSQQRRRPRNLRPAEARCLLAECASSGLSLAEFERRHHLSRNRLSWWLKRLGPAPSAAGGRPAPSSTAVTFLPVRVAGASPSPSPPRPPPPAAPIELVLPDGAIVRVPPSFDASTLTRLLDVLREARAC